MMYRHGLKFSLFLLLALLLVGCGIPKEEHDVLVKEHEELKATYEALTKNYSDLESENGRLAAEVKSLRETDQGYWELALAEEKAGNWSAVDNYIETLLDRWPQSSLQRNASSLRKKARNALALAAYNIAQTAIANEHAGIAKSKLEEIRNIYSDTKYAAKASSDLRSLDRKIAAAEKKREQEEKEERKQRARASSDLEATSFQWQESSGYAIAEGTVKNISGKSMKNVQAVGVFTDSSGGFITSSDAIIEYNPVLPGQTSPFKIYARWNPAMKSCRLEFKTLMGGKITTHHSWND